MEGLIKKKDNKKKIIIMAVIVLIIGIIVFITINRYNLLKNKGIGVDNDEVIVKDIKVDDFDEITVVNARVEKKGKASSIYVKVQNNTGEDMEECDLKLIVTDANNKVLTTSYIKNFKNLKIGDSREFQVSTNDDLSNASSYVVEKVKE